MSHSKRKSPPSLTSGTPSNHKRQRVSASVPSTLHAPSTRTAAAAAAAAAAAEEKAASAAVAAAAITAASSTPSVEPSAAAADDDYNDNDSLSSLSPVGSQQSSPEVELQSTLSGTGAGNEEGEGSKDEDKEEAGEEIEKDLHQKEQENETVEEEKKGVEEDEDEDEEEEAVTPADLEPVHHALSAKTLPSTQPRPSEVNGETSPNLNGNGRANTGGKGRKGEEALEHAVAAREEVERRRVESKDDQKLAAVTEAKNRALRPDLPLLAKESGEDMLVKEEEEEDTQIEPEESIAPVRRERPAIAEERANIIRFCVVTNDGSPSSLIILTGLKNIFQRQLPKMPREYIARLVFDRNHYSMAIVKRGLEVVGGITYRPFEARAFAEIVFCAITGTEQVKGYGYHLMNHLKDHVKATTSCMHFLTYADNYAIGYFKKQGFTKEIGLDRSVWAAYIKDYEGGTMMHCSILHRIKYLEVASILARQKEVILGEIRQRSQSHIVHPGLGLFASLAPGESIDPSRVPGLKDSGWTPEMDELTRRPKRGPQFAIMQRILTLLVDHPSAWAFANPVNAAEVTDYYDVIKEPMDLATMDRKLESNTYETLDEFVEDAQRIFKNCRSYNDPGSNYVKNANKLEAFLQEQVKVFQDG